MSIQLLPVHPHTGLRAIGVLPSGRVVWPVIGGAEDNDPPKGDDDNKPDDDPDNKPDDDKSGDDDPGKGKDEPDDDNGDDVKSQSRKWEARAKQNKKDLDATNAKLSAVLKAINGGKEPEGDPKEVAAQLQSMKDTATERLIENTVLRTAIRSGLDGDKLTDSRAFMKKVGKLDPEDDDFDAKVKRAISDYAKDRPEFKLSGGSNGKTGKSGTSVTGEGTKGQLTQADLDKMSPQEIVKAQAEGRLNDLLGVKK